MMAITSFRPPTPDSDSERTSTFQRCCSAKRVYMRNTSATNSDASSPPVPARISRMTFFSSFGSFGRSMILSSSSRAVACSSRRVNSSCAMAASSGSLSFSMPLASTMPWFACFSSRYLLTAASRSRCAFAVLWYFCWSVTICGSANWRPRSSYRVSICSRRSNIVRFLSPLSEQTQLGGSR